MTPKIVHYLQEKQPATPETKKLSKKFGTPVAIRRTAKGGKLEISFQSDDELQQLVQRLL